MADKKTHTILKATALSIGYNTKKNTTEVAKQLNFDLKKGQMVCLLGKNGIGKSTLLKTLSKTQAPLAGSISLEGKDTKQINAKALAKKMSLVLTERIPESQLTVYELIALGRQPYTNWFGRLTSEDQHKIETAMELSLIHISEPTRLRRISYAVFCLKKKK